MHMTDLSWVPLLDNLNSLSEEGLVSKDTTSNQWSYSVTKKGFEMIRACLIQSHEIPS
jgi:predicted transcriptional regulator